MNYGFHPLPIDSIRMRAYGATAVVVRKIGDEDPVVYYVTEKKKGGAKRMFDMSKLSFWLDIFRLYNTVGGVTLLAVGQSPLKEETVLRWLPEPIQTEHEKALNA